MKLQQQVLTGKKVFLGKAIDEAMEKWILENKGDLNI